MRQWLTTKARGQRAWWAAMLLVFVVACNVQDGNVSGPGQGDAHDDVGDLDVGQPDTATPADTGQPAASCDDGEQNGNETGVDCGGDCAPCSLGVGCEEGGDCASGFCAGNVCVD